MRVSIIPFTLIALAVTTASCGTTKSGTIRGNHATTVSTTTSSASSATTVTTGASTGSTHATAATATPSAPTAGSTATKAPAQKTPASPLGDVLAGQWDIVKAGNNMIDRDEDMPYITFEPAKARFYANNGCNTLNGTYVISGDGIEFFGVLSTMRYCADVPFEADINSVIRDNAPVKVTISTAGSETLANFIGGNGKSLMTIRRGNLDFLNGHWDVVSIAGVEKLEAPADIFFDLSEKKLHGNTGCNYFNGTIYMDHRRSNAIDFSNMGVTRMACPFTSQETSMLVALEKTASVISGSHDAVMLLDEDGNELMTLRRAADENE